MQHLEFEFRTWNGKSSKDNIGCYCYWNFAYASISQLINYESELLNVKWCECFHQVQNGDSIVIGLYNYT